MIEFNYQKYLVRDDAYQKECNEIINSIDEICDKNSFVGYIQGKALKDKLSLIIIKNDIDYLKFYKENYTKYSGLSDRLSWEFIEPLSDFENKAKLLLEEIESLLKERNYRTNGKSKDKIIILEKLIQEYSESTKLPDFRIRCQFHNKLNEIKKTTNSDSLISYWASQNIVSELEKIYKLNIELFNKRYLNVLKKLEITRIAFEKSKTFFSIKDIKLINEQFESIDQILKKETYDEFEGALEIIGKIDARLSEISSDKKTRIEESINFELEALKKSIWKEDWDKIKRGVDSLIAEADKTGQLYKLNLDKFNIDHLKSLKKEEIIKYLKITEPNKFKNSGIVITKAREMLNKEAYKKEFDELVKISPVIQKNKIKIPSEKKHFNKSIKIVSVFILLTIAVALFFINQAKNTAHFDAKGQKYVSIIETMVYSMRKSGSKVDIGKIRKKLQAPKEDLEIISINDDTVVINYKNKIYNKSIRKN